MQGIGRILGLAGVLAVTTGCLATLPEVADPCADWAAPGLYRLPVQGYSREPFIYVPGTAGPRDAIVALHGAGGDANGMLYTQTDFRERAEAEGFVAVFPNGSGPPESYAWNAGSCCEPSETLAADDLGFLEQVGVEIRERACVDRVVAAGQSNGGMMAMRWACEGTGVDGVLSSSGPLLQDTCTGAPVPVVASHATGDPIVPYGGGSGVGDEVFPAAPEAFQALVEQNQCEGEPTEQTDGAATCKVYDCAVPTTFCSLESERHRWPGGRNPVDGYVAESRALELFSAP